LRKIKSNIDFSVEFTSLILRVGETIDTEVSSGAHDTYVNDFLYTKDTKIEKILKSKVLYFTKFYEDNLDIPVERMAKIKYYLKRIKWKNIIPTIKKSFVGLSGFFKRKGVGLVVAFMLGLSIEYAMYNTLYSLGLARFIPVSMAIPYGTILSIIPSIRERFRIKRKLTKLLGGKEQYRAYQIQMKKSLENLKMKRPDQILFPIEIPHQAPETINTLILNRKSWQHSFLTRLGLNPRDLSYPSHNLYLLMNNLEDEYCSWIKGSDALTHPMKTALIVEHLMRTMNESNRLKFQKRFANNFTKVKRSLYWRALEDWTLKIMEVKDIDDIRRMMANIPYGVTPQQVLELWDNIILPHYSTSLKMNYRAYRGLKEKITVLKRISYSKDHKNWNDYFFKKFDEVLAESLHINFPTCKHPESMAVKFLLGH